MTPPPSRQVEKKPATPAGKQFRARPNSARPIQVMPPHNVELTLPPTVYDDIHVPAHVSGADLSHEAPADADAKAKARRTSR
ncbi:hypothetical protein [Rhizobium tubonense]|uniref:Uncharacterized protein n=1 Tax=Rhizobium tubonense TaxID=484088 RepID=A0A2W4CGZ5_9HYPH|nr:hypothetical protein [Rhizobium tubonense]PZM10348.1 hypothetical protein CPY51_23645 [Rhizobium tubonense]